MNKIISEDEWSALAQMSGSLKDLLQSTLKFSVLNASLEVSEHRIYPT
jgi:hypothetical protein